MPIDPIDQELTDQANRGDGASFEKLYFRHRDWVYRLAYRFTMDRDDALDVLQETFAYWLQKFPGFELTAGLTTFLYPVVKHLAITQQQKRRRHSPTTENLPEIAQVLDVPSGTVKSRLYRGLQTLKDDPRTRNYFNK